MYMTNPIVNDLSRLLVKDVQNQVGIDMSQELPEGR